MRCPKCGFNSFDHNLFCPKCHKDLNAARRLLNLSLPAPGSLDFFAAAVPESPAEIFPVPPPAEPEPDIIETLTPVDEIETIEPADDDDDISPEDELEEILPDEAQGEEDIAPLEPGDFAAHLARAEAAPESEAPIEIELDEDDVEEVQAEPMTDDFEATHPAAKAAMRQIKSALTATGDLAEEPAPELEPIKPDGAEAANVVILDDDDEFLEAAPLSQPAADDELEDDSDLDSLSDLVEDLNLDDIDTTQI